MLDNLLQHMAMGRYGLYVWPVFMLFGVIVFIQWIRLKRFRKQMWLKLSRWYSMESPS